MYQPFVPSTTHSLLSDRAPEAVSEGIVSERAVIATENDRRLGLVERARRDLFGWLRWVGW